MNSHLILITDDLFDIAARLTSVKSDYVVYYNKILRRYEVHDNKGFAFAVPYSELDCRTIDYALKTSISRADEIFAEVEKHNKRLTSNAIKNAVTATANKFNYLKEVK